MFYLTCADFKIPLCFVQSISWTKKARTITHTGGYVTSRGFDPAEISVKLHVDFATCKTFGFSPQEIFAMIDSTHTDRISKPGVFSLGNYAVYPTLEFALTNINKTYLPEKGIIECDCVWSGVKAVKRVASETVLDVQPVSNMPKLTLSVMDKSLSIQDFCHVTKFVTTPDSIQLAMSIGNDLDLINRNGFLEDILTGNITAELPQGTTKFYVIEADLTDELLSLTGSIFPPNGTQIVRETYMNKDLSEIINDLTDKIGVECECLVSGEIDYYQAFGTPLECLRRLQAGAGFIMSYRQGKITAVDVPGGLNATTELSYIDIQADSDIEPIRGCYWYDGIHADIYGMIDKNALRIEAPFRSTYGFAKKCLAFARYQKNAIVVRSELLPTLDTHSIVSVALNDSIVNAMAEWFEMDWVGNVMTVELHAV